MAVAELLPSEKLLTTENIIPTCELNCVYTCHQYAFPVQVAVAAQ